MPPASTSSTQDVYNRLPDVLGSVPELRRCDCCGKPQKNDPTLRFRQCKRCARAMYCNKRCQKAAWPTHKVICFDPKDLSVPLTTTSTARNPTDLSSLGYPSLGALVTALQNFREAHDWSFRSLAKSLVLQHGGIDWSQSPQKILSFCVIPLASMGVRERNHARTFLITSYGFSILDDLLAANPLAVDEWMGGEPRRKTVADAYRWHPNYAGLLPVNFFVTGLNVTLLEYHPQFRAPCPSSPIPTPLLADEESKKALLEDIAALSAHSIVAGIPLRPMEGSGPEGMLLALPGRFVRRQSASWIWTALFSSWEDYRRGEHSSLDDLLDTLNFRHTPAEMMVAFNML